MTKQPILKSIPGALFALVILQGPAWASEFSPQEDIILGHIEREAEAQIDFIERVVNINSGTMNVVGVRAVGEIFAAEFRALGMQTEWIEMPGEMGRAGHLVARTSGARGKAGRGKRLLLLGHMDTVFPKDSPFQTFKRYSEGDGATGPGVEDMKGGNAMIL